MRILLISFCLIFSTFLIGQNQYFIKVCYGKNYIRIALNGGNTYTTFFDKQLEKIKIKDGHFVCEVSENRLRVDIDTLIIDLTSTLNNIDSLDKRVKRHINYGRWVPTYLEPHQRIAYNFRIRRSYLRQISIIKILIEIDGIQLFYTINKNEYKDGCTKAVFGKML